MVNVTIEDGKYTIRQLSPGEWEVLRHGEPWPAFDKGGPDNLHKALAYHISDMTEKHAGEIAALEALRPHWAQGHSSDSVAAQASTAALSQIWEALGATNQTEAMERVKLLQLAGRTLTDKRDAFEQSVEDILDPPKRGGFKLTEDTPTGGEGNGLAITGRLRECIKGPWFPGSPDVLNGQVYGHAKFMDGMPIHTSTVVEDLGDGLFKTKSGSIYKVESWLPGHEPK